MSYVVSVVCLLATALLFQCFACWKNTGNTRNFGNTSDAMRCNAILSLHLLIYFKSSISEIILSPSRKLQPHLTFQADPLPYRLKKFPVWQSSLTLCCGPTTHSAIPISGAQHAASASWLVAWTPHSLPPSISPRLSSPHCSPLRHLSLPKDTLAACPSLYSLCSFPRPGQCTTLAIVFASVSAEKQRTMTLVC
jgi:hypothetical protein